jgi:hypothetical protein
VTKKPADPSVVVDASGKVLDLPPAEVKRTALRMFDEGTLLAVIVQAPNGDLSVQVMGPPSIQLAEALEEAARNYRIAVAHAKP